MAHVQHTKKQKRERTVNSRRNGPISDQTTEGGLKKRQNAKGELARTGGACGKTGSVKNENSGRRCHTNFAGTEGNGAERKNESP